MKKRKNFKKTKKRIAVIFGGAGAEHEISLRGGEFVLKTLDRESFDALPLLIDRGGDWYLTRDGCRIPVAPTRRCGTGGILRGRRFIRLDAAFPVLHGDFGEDGRVQGLLDILGIPYVGCGTSAGALCADKSFTKSVAAALGIPTLPWFFAPFDGAQSFCTECLSHLALPIFVKPVGLGSSVGAGVAESEAELGERAKIAAELGGGRVIAEKYLRAPRELECAVLELDGRVYISPPGEVRSCGSFYGFEEKYSPSSAAYVSARAELEPQIAEAITEYTGRLVRAIGIRGLARADYFFDGEGVYFNEINTMPGMTESSLYPKMIEMLGISAHEMINGLVTAAVGGAR